MPMSDESEIELRTHLMMLENFLLMLFAKELKGELRTPEAFTVWSQEMLSKARKETFGSTSPEMSDHINAVYEQQVARFLAGLGVKLGLRPDT